MLSMINIKKFRIKYLPSFELNVEVLNILNLKSW